MNAVAVQQHSRLRDYLDLTKPRITLLVLVTTFAGMWLAAHGLPTPELLLATLIGVGLAASSSSTLNNYIDREVDKRMERTRDRALPAGRLQPDHALIWGIVLGMASFALLAAAVNWISAFLAAGTILFYVFIYTIWLKRTTPVCTSVGGVAGALPPLIGWTAVTGHFDLIPLALFAIIFLWQPPHFWALALLRLEEYRAAGFPMLPVIRGAGVTKRQMALYTLGLVLTSLLPYFLGAVGPYYLGATALLGAGYLILTAKFIVQEVTPQSAKQLFLYSVLYLTLLFGMFFLD
jgi:protoheme IX farnesyltransferase